MNEWDKLFQAQVEKWLDDSEDVISEALMDAVVFGEGKVRRNWDGDLECVPHPGREGCKCGGSAATTPNATQEPCQHGKVPPCCGFRPEGQ